MKKDKGNIMSIFPPLFAIIAVAVMLVFYIGWMGNVNKNDEVRQIGREYILAMETEGRLTSSLESSMRADLSSKGLKNIDLSGTTTSDVGYWNEIFFSIKGYLEVDSFNTTGFLQLVRGTDTIPIEIKLASTAKH